MVPLGHARKIAQLLREHAARLELYASQWTQSPEDCVQEAFVELARQAQLPTTPLAWLYRVVRNRAFNESRSARRRTNHEQVAGELIAARLANRRLDRQAERRKDLAEAMQGLNEQQREVVILRIWSGLTWSEIAEVTHTSSSGAHRCYVAALQSMKRFLDPTCLKSSK